LSEPENIRSHEWYTDGFTRNRATYLPLDGGGWALVADNPAHDFRGQGPTQVAALRAFVAKVLAFKPADKVLKPGTSRRF
jgi:hypothetical protein